MVDDHAGFRQMVKTMLAVKSATFAECASGWEALDRYSQFKPDLVLMDISMEGLDGLSATEQIKVRFPDARVFILTQFDDPELRKAAHEAGASGYILKEDLSQLQALLGGDRVTR